MTPGDVKTGAGRAGARRWRWWAYRAMQARWGAPLRPGLGTKGHPRQGQPEKTTKEPSTGSARGQVAGRPGAARPARSKKEELPAARTGPSGTEGGPKHRTGASGTEQSGKRAAPLIGRRTGRGPGLRTGRPRKQQGGPQDRSARGRNPNGPGLNNPGQKKKEEATKYQPQYATGTGG